MAPCELQSRFTTILFALLLGVVVALRSNMRVAGIDGAELAGARLDAVDARCVSTGRDVDLE